jgi:hypothetical protein
MSQDIQQALGITWPPPLQEGVEGSSSKHQSKPAAAAAAVAAAGSDASSRDQS